MPEEVILKRISEPRSLILVLNATLIAITMYRHESLNRVEEPIGGGAEAEGTNERMRGDMDKAQGPDAQAAPPPRGQFGLAGFPVKFFWRVGWRI